MTRITLTCLRHISYNFDNFQLKNFDIFSYICSKYISWVKLKYFDCFHILAQNIDCGYTLEPPK